MTVDQLPGAVAQPGKPERPGLAAGPGARRRGHRTIARRKAGAFYLFVAPWAAGFALLTAFPLGYALWMSLTSSDGISPRWHFVGLANYRELLSDPVTLQSLGRTALFTAVTVPAGMAAGLLLAVLVNQPLRARGLFRTLLYLPAVVPPVGAALTFKAVFSKDAGAANGVLDVFGTGPVAWLVDPYARFVIMMLVLWTAGNCMIISLAGLQDMPRELLEAARLDGASSWQTFRRITLPLLSPVLLFQCVTGVIAALQTFMPLLLANISTPAGVTSVPQGNYMYMINVFAQYFAYGRFGYASALLWVLFLVILVITALIFRLTSGAVFYNVEPEPKKP